jgi:MtN3 and saliva related transmembrane protein
VEWVNTSIGLVAAICTTASFAPQVKKTWTTRETDDLSLKMLLLLATGLPLWFVYGFLIGDGVVMLANGVSFLMLISILYCKLWGRRQLK